MNSNPTDRHLRAYRRLSISALVVLAVLLAPAAQNVRAAIDAEQVRRAIDRGVAFLKSQQKDNGSWPDVPSVPVGISALCTLALLTAGVPVDDPDMRSALEYLRRQRLAQTYSVSLQTMVLAAAEPKRDLFLIRQNVQWLESQQIHEGPKKGAWSYGNIRPPVGRANGDNSNTQFALLGLHEAERVGVPVKEQTWRLVQNYWQRTQNLDGSWGYMEGNAGTGSMTCAGIAALVIAEDRLHRGDAEVQGEQVRCCGQQEENPEVERALQWLSMHFAVHSNPGDGSHLLYYLYGLERVGRLTNRRIIGRHDWYREGADLLVHSQEELQGFWHGVGHGEDGPLVGTSLALLFLAKGRRPVLMAKLKHPPRDDWNHHRTDVANLTGYVEQRWHRDLTWQVIDIQQATADDLNQAPVLFLSGRDAPEFSDAQVAQLREYIDRGGFLFAEDCCNDGSFDAGFRRLMERVFPEPEYRLYLLPPEHPVWHSEETVDPDFMPPLYGIDVGCRTSVVYCTKNLGCYWELARPDRELKYAGRVKSQIEAARSVGINVLAYATNRELKFKLEIPPVVEGGQAGSTIERAKLYVARLRHQGGWNVAPSALPNLMKVVAQQTGLRVQTDEQPLSLADKRLFDYPIVFMHGRNAFSFSPQERRQMRDFVDRGGVLFADATCSNPDFAASFRREMKAIFPDRPLEPIPASHALFSNAFGGFDLKKVGRREPRLREAGGMKSAVRQVEPELEGLQTGGAYSVIFSAYDLSCALERHESLECAGYTRDDAARIGLNVVLYALQE